MSFDKVRQSVRARVNKGRAGGGTDTAFWVSCVIQLRISTGYMRTCCDMYIAFLFILQISHKYNDQRDVWPLTTCLVMAERVRPFSTLLQTPGGNRHARITVSTSIADYTSPPPFALNFLKTWLRKTMIADIDGQLRLLWLAFGSI